MDISIICCFNDKKSLNEILVASLNRQTGCDYELIAIDNTDSKFSNCADALNWGIDQAKADSIICVHQDFEFVDKDCLRTINNQLKQAEEYDVLGPAGAIYDKNASIKRKLFCRSRKCIDTLLVNNSDRSKKISKKTEVDSLDECCLCFKKILWTKHHFSADLCPYWDLYGVELCLYTRYFLRGKAYVIPIHAIHHSGGNLTERFYKALYNIMISYKGKVDRITTTCVSVKPRFALLKYQWLKTTNHLR